MAYDVFLVSALEDRDMAKLVARRLRALKFKVSFDQKQVNDTLDDKDARNISRSDTILVLWSEHAVQSDWVRAAASIGHSREGSLLQVGLDKTIPYQPFKKDKRYVIAEMTSRKTPEAFYKLVEDLGARTGRTDLREWMGLSSKDEEGRLDWILAHPDDPIAIDHKKKQEKALGKKPALADEAKGAAALAAASIKPTVGSATLRSAPMRPTPGREDIDNAPDLDAVVGRATIVAVAAAIVAMLALSWWFRTDTVAANTQALPPIGNASLIPAACPPGQIPRSLIRVEPLEPGPIVNDTSDDSQNNAIGIPPPDQVLEPGPIIDDTDD